MNVNIFVLILAGKKFAGLKRGNDIDKRNRSFIVDMHITFLLVLNKSLLYNTYYVHTRNINYYILDYDEVKLDTELASWCKLR